MKDFFKAVDKSKAYPLMVFIVCNTVTVMHTVSALLGWAYTKVSPDAFTLQIMALSWFATLALFFLVVATCCIRVEDEVAGNARTKRAIHEMQIRTPE